MLAHDIDALRLSSSRTIAVATVSIISRLLHPTVRSTSATALKLQASNFTPYDLWLQVMKRQLTGGVAGPGADTCMLLESDPERFLELGRSKDGAYVTVNSNSKTSSEVLLTMLSG